ncbi:unnamed protein product [Rhizoctonia solani]|uniref:Uncharacterized protein n=1 Tax=Rhizoctonia solani TaxID=456999 RepID=A0A8H2Y6W4_9AGAM|nr:unnamed protein product [Rhizoctonia solani]
MDSLPYTAMACSLIPDGFALLSWERRRRASQWPILSFAFHSTRCTARKTRRIKLTDMGSQFRDQLNIWSDRIRFGPIQYITNQTHFRNDDGHLLYQAIPIFPRVIHINGHYAAQGRSQLEARDMSLSMIRHARLSVSANSINFVYEPGGQGLVVAQPYCLVQYGPHESLTDQHVIGWGTSIRRAEEDAAQKLLTSGHYCFC